MHHFGYGCYDPCGYGYGVAAPTYTSPIAGYGNGFILLVVLFILLIIVGGSYYTAG